MNWNLTIIRNGAGEKIVKLKSWAFFWGHGECEWPLVVALHIGIKIWLHTWF